jgi:hypothetical protein
VRVRKLPKLTSNSLSKVSLRTNHSQVNMCVLCEVDNLLRNKEEMKSKEVFSTTEIPPIKITCNLGEGTFETFGPHDEVPPFPGATNILDVLED